MLPRPCRAQTRCCLVKKGKEEVEVRKKKKKAETEMGPLIKMIVVRLRALT